MMLLLLTSSALVIILVILIIVLVALVAFIVATVLVVRIAGIGIVVTTVKLSVGFSVENSTLLTPRHSTLLPRVVVDVVGCNRIDRCSLVDGHPDSRRRWDAVDGHSRHHTGLADGPT
jgi:hypothetical protein